MIPQEIFEHKIRWLKSPAAKVSFDEFLEYEAKRWCRQHIVQQSWDFTPYTDIYEHTILFENEADAEAFQQWLYMERLI